MDNTQSMLFDFVQLEKKIKKVKKDIIEKQNLFVEYQDLKFIGKYSVFFTVPILVNFFAIMIYAISNQSITVALNTTVFTMFAISYIGYGTGLVKKDAIFKEKSIGHDLEPYVVCSCFLFIFSVLGIWIFPNEAFIWLWAITLIISITACIRKISADNSLKQEKYYMTEKEKDGTLLVELKDELKELTKHYNFLLHRIVEEEKALKIVLDFLKNPSSEFTDEYIAYNDVAKKLKQLEKKIKKREKEFFNLKSIAKNFFKEKNANKKKVELINK